MSLHLSDTIIIMYFPQVFQFATSSLVGYVLISLHKSTPIINQTIVLMYFRDVSGFAAIFGSFSPCPFKSRKSPLNRHIYTL